MRWNTTQSTTKVDVNCIYFISNEVCKLLCLQLMVCDIQVSGLRKNAVKREADLKEYIKIK